MHHAFRARLAMWGLTAVLVLYGYVRADGGVLERLFIGAGMGLVAPVVVLVVIAIARGGLLGEELKGDPYTSQQLLPGLVLFAVMWIWWHEDRHRRFRDLVACAENAVAYDGLDARTAIRSCYENPSTDDPSDGDARFP